MDIERLLERRSGVKDDDIDSFLNKVSAVEDSIKGLISGTVKPEDVRIDGVLTTAELQEQENELKIRREEQKKKTEILRQHRKVEEKERWWNSAKAMNSNTESIDNDEHVSKQGKLNQKYSSDYSRWEEWVPDDPISAEEARHKEEEEDRIKNEAFEKANSDFCNNVLEDMKSRDKVIKKKEKSSEVLRNEGNNFFKMKDYQTAITHYVDALKILPFDVRILINIAQSYLKLGNYDDAEEFLNRTLFLKPNHVKALSRQAFLFEKTNRPEEALKAAKRASEVEPDNSEVRLQVLEYEALVHELKDSRVIADLKAGRVSITTSSTLSTTTTSVNDVDGFQCFDVLVDCLRQLLPDGIQPTVENSVASGDIYTNAQSSNSFTTSSTDTTSPSLLQLFDALTRCYHVLKQSTGPADMATLAEKRRLLQTYFRTSTALDHCVRYCLANSSRILESKPGSMNCLSETTTATGSQAELVKDNGQTTFILNISLCLRLLAVGIAGQFSSMTQVSGTVLFRTIKDTLKLWATSTKSSSSSASQSIVIGFLELTLSCCCMTERNGSGQSYCIDTVRKDLLTSQDILVSVIQILTRGLLHNESTPGSTSTSDGLPVIILGSQYLYEVMMFHFVQQKSSKSELLPSEFQVIGVNEMFKIQLVGLCTALLRHCRSDLTVRKSSLYPEAVKAVLEVLLACSQVEAYRPSFASPLPSQLLTSSSPSSSAITEIVALLLSTSTSKDEFSGPVATSLAVLMNICVASNVAASPNGNPDLSPTVAIPKAVYDAGGLRAAETSLGLTRAAREATDPLILSRTAGLLARLSVLESVRKYLQTPSVYRKVCRALADNTASTSSTRSSSSTGSRNHFIEEQGHIVRILAGLDRPDKTCLEEAHKEQLVPSLLAVFPDPRQDAGEVTPETVTLSPPGGCGSPILLGNAARCLMPFADDSAHAELLFRKPEHRGIEKLVCCMANCTDMRVRKNIAILLAKGCKLPGVRERVEKFRGLQIMRELQDKL